MTPPPHIDGALVLEWAWSEIPFGELRSSDGSIVTAIHGLALCRYEGSSTIYRFSCDANWETEQDSDHSSIEQAKAHLPEQYRRVPTQWIKTSVRNEA